MIIGSKPGFTGGIAEFCEPWKKCSIHRRWHTDFKEIGKYERLAGLSHVYFCTYCKDTFVIAAVTKQQIQFYDDVTCNTDILCAENRSSHTLVITA